MARQEAPGVLVERSPARAPLRKRYSSHSATPMLSVSATAARVATALRSAPVITSPRAAYSTSTPVPRPKRAYGREAESQGEAGSFSVGPPASPAVRLVVPDSLTAGATSWAARTTIGAREPAGRVSLDQSGTRWTRVNSASAVMGNRPCSRARSRPRTSRTVAAPR
ncbi:hypothetical protein [Streptomyces sp. NBC_00391]|uniref:hypothetical protein n=1 Tax=Streptomyces sp. NBC_00391 TaxID=2903647 RepID=UPI002E209052